jgi:hypothetical protein
LRRFLIVAGSVKLEAELNDSPTARLIADALPLDGRANTWGDEIYFNIALPAEREPDAREELEVGELGYWPPGQAFCIFFGRTPASVGDEPRAASAVNVIGKVIGNARAFKSVQDGEIVFLSPAPTR